MRRVRENRLHGATGGRRRQRRALPSGAVAGPRALPGVGVARKKEVRGGGAAERPGPARRGGAGGTAARAAVSTEAKSGLDIRGPVRYRALHAELAVQGEGDQSGGNGCQWRYDPGRAAGCPRGTGGTRPPHRRTQRAARGTGAGDRRPAPRERRLRAQVVELEARAGQNSRNSSRPPSADPPCVPRRPRRSGRQPGGQPGHPGHSCPLVPPEQVERRVPCYPEHCANCHTALPAGKCVEVGVPLVHQVHDIEIRRRVTQYDRAPAALPALRGEHARRAAQPR